MGKAGVEDKFVSEAMAWQAVVTGHKFIDGASITSGGASFY